MSTRAYTVVVVLVVALAIELQGDVNMPQGRAPEGFVQSGLRSLLSGGTALAFDGNPFAAKVKDLLVVREGGTPPATQSAGVVANAPLVPTYTGCYNPITQRLSKLAQGPKPSWPCLPREVLIRLSSADITAVDTPPESGLLGGTENGNASLALQPSFRLPQTCQTGQHPEWDGTGWVCAAPSAPEVATMYDYIDIAVPQSGSGVTVAWMKPPHTGKWLATFDLGLRNDADTPRTVACMFEAFGSCFLCWVEGLTIAPHSFAMLHYSGFWNAQPAWPRVPLNCTVGDPGAGDNDVHTFQVHGTLIAADVVQMPESVVPAPPSSGPPLLRGLTEKH
jgi:hypothetical protein